MISPDFRNVEATFANGRSGTVDLSGYPAKGGVFQRFRDLEFFRRFRVDPEAGVLTWDGEIDVAPETLYAQATGTPLPDWMVHDEPMTTESTEPVRVSDSKQ